jgi:hypothetical protein
MKERTPRVARLDGITDGSLIGGVVILAPNRYAVGVWVPLKHDGQGVTRSLVKFAEHGILGVC